MFNSDNKNRLKKVPIGSLGQADYLAGQVRFNGQGSGQVIQYQNH